MLILCIATIWLLRFFHFPSDLYRREAQRAKGSHLTADDLQEAHGPQACENACVMSMGPWDVHGKHDEFIWNHGNPWDFSWEKWMKLGHLLRWPIQNMSKMVIFIWIFRSYVGLLEGNLPTTCFFWEDYYFSDLWWCIDILWGLSNKQWDLVRI